MTLLVKRKCSKCNMFKPHTRYAGAYGHQFICEDCKMKMKERVKENG